MKFLVYGTLKRAFGNHRILHEGGAQYLGRALTLNNYVMVGYGCPFVWANDRGYPVVGELYDIGDERSTDDRLARRARQTLSRLDRLESNGSMYQRVERSVRMLTDPHGIMPLPRDAGETHDGVWVYEAMTRIERKPAPDDADVLMWLDEAGRLEWESERSKKPMDWKPRRPVHIAENIGSLTADHRARPLGEILREEE